MEALRVIITVLLLVASLILIASILLQPGKSAGISGAIGGGAEQLFGRQKGRRLEQIAEKATKISAIVFMVAAIILVVLQ